VNTAVSFRLLDQLSKSQRFKEDVASWASISTSSIAVPNLSTSDSYFGNGAGADLKIAKASSRKERNK
jgi:hypothetical protein